MGRKIGSEFWGFWLTQLGMGVHLSMLSAGTIPLLNVASRMLMLLGKLQCGVELHSCLQVQWAEWVLQRADILKLVR